MLTDLVNALGRLDVLMNLVGGFTSGQILTLNVTSAFFLFPGSGPQDVHAEIGSHHSHRSARSSRSLPWRGSLCRIESGSCVIDPRTRLELTGTGVPVNGILPTTIDTPAHRQNMPVADLSKWVRLESIAQTLLFLASDEGDQINGALVPVG